MRKDFTLEIHQVEAMVPKYPRPIAHSRERSLCYLSRESNFAQYSESNSITEPWGVQEEAVELQTRFLPLHRNGVAVAVTHRYARSDRPGRGPRRRIPASPVR